MPRKHKKGYYVRGQFVAEGSALDEEFKRELRGDGPSKTELKAQSAELQALGEQLLTLRPSLLAGLDLPIRLLDALHELQRIANFEGKRRQSQYVGKLMRQLDEEQVAAIHTALHTQRKGAAAETLRLHAAEQWRERLIAQDSALAEWLAQHPGTDVQQLRALIRQARKDAPDPHPADGLPPRQGRAYREIFQIVREALIQAEEAAEAEAAASTDADTAE